MLPVFISPGGEVRRVGKKGVWAWKGRREGFSCPSPCTGRWEVGEHRSCCACKWSSYLTLCPLKKINQKIIFLWRKSHWHIFRWNLGNKEKQGRRLSQLLCYWKRVLPFWKAKAGNRWNSTLSSKSCDTWGIAEGDWSAHAMPEVKFCWWEVIQISLLSKYFFSWNFFPCGKCEPKLKAAVTFAWI